MLTAVSGNLGYLSGELSNFVAIFLFATFVLLFLTVKIPLTDIKKNVHIVIICFVSTGIFFFSHDTISQLITLTLFVFAFDLLFQKAGMMRAELSLFLLTASGYSIWNVFYHYSPQPWFWLQDLAVVFSNTAEALTRQSVQYGATYLGLQILILFIIFHLSIFLLSKKKQTFVLIVNIVLLVVITAVYPVIHLFTVRELTSLSPRLFTNLLNTNSMLFLLLLPSSYFYMRTSSLRCFLISGFDIKRGCAVAACLLFFFAGSAFMYQTPEIKRPGKILFYDQGYLNWNLPVFDKYGGREGGMFGLLPHYLRRQGYETQKSIITPEALESASSLVIINLKDRFDDTDKKTIWDFVQRGGRLLILGDHTGDEQIRKPFNDLLSSVGISFNFDSAIPFETGWPDALEIRPHIITRAIADEVSTRIGIGASLSITPPAQPIIIARYGFSDPGNIHDYRRGYLGNMRYDFGEKLGDLVLAAERPYGKGSVLVFGDTSSFQNGALVQSSQFVDAVFAWLIGGQGTAGQPYNGFFLILFPAAAILFLLSIRPAPQTAAVIVMFFTAAHLYSGQIVPDVDNMNDHTMSILPLAYIDISHCERFSLNSWQPDSIDGLAMNLIRNGYLPLVLRDFSLEMLLDCKLMVIVAPARPFSETEVTTLEKFVNRGGFLILSVGYEEKEASQKILNRFRVDIDNIPLGPAGPDRNDLEIQFHETWPVTATNKEAEVLCQVWDYPVIVFQPVKKGGVLVIGDSSFLLNNNLEGRHNYLLPNIMFLKKIISAQANFIGFGSRS